MRAGSDDGRKRQSLLRPQNSYQKCIRRVLVGVARCSTRDPPPVCCPGADSRAELSPALAGSHGAPVSQDCVAGRGCARPGPRPWRSPDPCPRRSTGTPPPSRSRAGELRLTIGAVGVRRPGRQDLAGDQVLQGRVQREGAVHDPGLPPDEAADHRRLQRDAQRLGEAPPQPEPPRPPLSPNSTRGRRTRPARSGSTRSGRSTTATPTALCWCTTSRTSTRSPA